MGSGTEAGRRALRFRHVAVLRLAVPRRPRPDRHRIVPPLPGFDVRRGGRLRLLQHQPERLVGGRDVV